MPIAYQQSLAGTLNRSSGGGGGPVDTSADTVFRLPMTETPDGNRTDTVNSLVFTQRFSGSTVTAVVDGSRSVARFDGDPRCVLENEDTSIQTAVAGDWSFMIRMRPQGGTGSGQTYFSIWDGDVNEEIFRFRKGSSNTFAMSVNSSTNNATSVAFRSDASTNYVMVIGEWNWWEFRYDSSSGLMRARMNDNLWTESTHSFGALYSQSSPIIPCIIGGTHDRNSTITPKDTKDEVIADYSHVQMWSKVITDEIAAEVRSENAY